MEITEILEKTNITQQEMEFIVEEYIFAKKGTRVKIRIDTRNRLYFQLQMQLLFDTFWVAFKHFKK